MSMPRACVVGLMAVLVIVAVGIVGCGGSGLPGECNKLCKKSGECSQQESWLFSISECKRECGESFERMQIIGCDKLTVDYQKCVLEVDCTLWDDLNDACESEIENLTACIQDEAEGATPLSF